METWERKSKNRKGKKKFNTHTHTQENPPACKAHADTGKYKWDNEEHDEFVSGTGRQKKITEHGTNKLKARKKKPRLSQLAGAESFLFCIFCFFIHGRTKSDMKSKRNVTGEESRRAMQLVGVYDMSIYLQDASSECAVQCQEKEHKKRH